MRRAVFGFLFTLLLVCPAAGQDAPTTVVVGASDSTQLKFVGSYRPDGRYMEGKKAGRLPSETAIAWQLLRQTRPAEVPPWIDLQPYESVVEDSSYKQKSFTTHGSLTNAFERLVTIAYGRELALLSPSHLTMDSRKRLIVCDAMIPAVHILDGKNSFRIEGGRGRRLQHPSSVAVDADDNLYVSDPIRRLVLVYSADGTFERYIGLERGESAFGMPTGLAIDRKAGLLYVVDSEANEVIVLSLDGTIVRRIGDFRKHAEMKFDAPTQIAERDGKIAVLDSNGTRVQLFNVEGRLQTEITLPNRLRIPVAHPMGLALDRDANIYVMDSYAEELRVYSSSGAQLYVVARTSDPKRDFSAPSGVWVDGSGRLLVADTGHSRIQVFELAATAPATISALAAPK